jgi:hypothetical protein
LSFHFFSVEGLQNDLFFWTQGKSILNFCINSAFVLDMLKERIKIFLNEVLSVFNPKVPLLNRFIQKSLFSLSLSILMFTIEFLVWIDPHEFARSLHSSQTISVLFFLIILSIFCSLAFFSLRLSSYNKESD